MQRCVVTRIGCIDYSGVSGVWTRLLDYPERTVYSGDKGKKQISIATGQYREQLREIEDVGRQWDSRGTSRPTLKKLSYTYEYLGYVRAPRAPLSLSPYSSSIIFAA